MRRGQTHGRGASAMRREGTGAGRAGSRATAGKEETPTERRKERMWGGMEDLPRASALHLLLLRGPGTVQILQTLLPVLMGAVTPRAE